jgi:hypothetical protein
MKYLIITAAVFLISALGFIALKGSPEKTLEKFWQYSLEGNFDEAAKYTAEESDLDFEGGSKGFGKAVMMDGTISDHTNKDRIFKRQIRLEEILKEDSKGYRMGYLISTTDKDNSRENYIVCLGQKSSDKSWAVFTVLYEKVFSEKKNIAESCFEGSTMIEDSIKKGKQIEAELNANKAATESNANRK